MPRVSDSVTLQRTGDVLVCALKGETGSELMSGLRREMQLLMEDTSLRTVILDLSEVTFMNTTGINFLIYSKRQAEESGKALRLRSVAEQVEKVLRLVQLHEFFIYEETEQ